MLPKTRLGKRSPLGALVSSPGAHTHLETGESGITVATTAGQQASNRLKGHPGLKVRGNAGNRNKQNICDEKQKNPSHVSVPHTRMMIVMVNSPCGMFVAHSDPWYFFVSGVFSVWWSR